MRLAFATSLAVSRCCCSSAASSLPSSACSLVYRRCASAGSILALVTLMLAAGVEIVLDEVKFPNGGPGFRGVVNSLS